MTRDSLMYKLAECCYNCEHSSGPNCDQLPTLKVGEIGQKVLHNYVCARFKLKSKPFRVAS